MYRSRAFLNHTLQQSHCFPIGDGLVDSFPGNDLEKGIAKSHGGLSMETAQELHMLRKRIGKEKLSKSVLATGPRQWTLPPLFQLNARAKDN